MKNLITGIAFAFAMVLSIQTTTAQTKLSQDQDRPEVIAKQQTAELTEQLSLNGEQSRAVFRALVANEINYKKHVNGKKASDPTVVASKKKFDSSLDENMKKTLTKEQYESWVKMKKG
ncbi:hypothetical protein [Cochleicola gelatinilyticus]|nr:hypothetical protein [Cochleicola gelatinilyticus]